MEPEGSGTLELEVPVTPSLHCEGPHPHPGNSLKFKSKFFKLFALLEEEKRSHWFTPFYQYTLHHNAYGRAEDANWLDNEPTVMELQVISQL